MTENAAQGAGNERMIPMLTTERARELIEGMITQENLLLHVKNVCYAMGAMARHFGAGAEQVMALGLLHDYHY